MQAHIWWLAGAAALVAAVAGWFERRRAARANLDRVGWVPWTGLFVAAFFVAVVAAALGLKS